MDINQDFLNALIEVESSNNPKAFNPSSGARGLTQITPVAWQDLVAHYPDKYSQMNYEKDMFKPEVAKQAGNDYLNILMGYLRSKRMPITPENLAAGYNWGINNLAKFGLHNAPPETKNYIAKIRKLLSPQTELIDAKYESK